MPPRFCIEASANAESITVPERLMAFYFLLLGHLIGDFVLQTDKIAENKCRHWKWNLLHVLVVTFCTLGFAYPFGSLLFGMVLLNGAVHFLLDYYKAQITIKLRLPDLAGFLLDQSIHILLLYLISHFAVYGNQPLIDFIIVKYLMVLTFVTSFSAVFTQFVLAALFQRDGSRFFEKGEKNVGILARIYIVIVFYMSVVQSTWYLLLLLVVAAAFFLQFKLGWSKWMSPSHLAVKLLFDTVISAACVFLAVLL